MSEQEGQKEAQVQTSVARRRALGFPDIFDEMDRLWGTIMPMRWRPFATGRAQVMPTLDVFEKDAKLHVQAELPGMTAKDIQIEVTKDSLTISGEKRDEREVKEEDYYRSERSYGSFRRQVALPAGADTDNIEATFKDGLLTVQMPVTQPAAATKKIEIKGSE